MKVFRGTLEAVDGKALRAFLLKEEADVAIIRTPGDGQGVAAQFERAGFPFLHADVLVYYETDLQSLAPKAIRNTDLEFVLCDEVLQPALAELVKTIFSGYRNHYNANPFLPEAKILAGFQEWAVDYGKPGVPGRCAWLVRRGGTWVAFATCSESGDTCEGVLYGVHPDHAGGGLYSDLIRFTQAHFKMRGFKLMKVSTQVHNLAVQKVWGREGFSLSQCLHTWHVNPMLSYTERPPVERTLRVDAAAIEAYGRASGDLNPIHFDDEAARGLGLPGRIAHGLLANGWISKVLGMEFPGPGTLFQGYQFLFLAPMLPGGTYRLRLTTLRAGERGAWKCLGRIMDDQGATIVLAYADLALKGKAAQA
ncbi:MAG TPA: bifunctional GNAT family N-acetyltransferase/hotdog fold thioesterase [Holophagaceae bacterium]|nr:bifunctional GNAT family N-acetyltransferase/hotdog fold thioesterase [Holophagaceae bacterium]